MQLDLFSDNRRTILLNDAGTMLRSLDLEKAISVYAGLLDDSPGDREILRLKRTVGQWLDTLARYRVSPLGSERLHELWLQLKDDTPPLLADGILRILIAELEELPAPELIYHPPRFHVGVMMLSAGRYAEAEQWFAKALRGGIEKRARFLAWRGDALTLDGDKARARESYLAAFLEGPHDVEIESIESRTIRGLLFSLESEYGDETGDDTVSWLPVWGWLHGEFSLAMGEITRDRSTFRVFLEESERSGDIPLPRLWFEYLRYGEFLRTLNRDDRELVRIRRRMRDLCGIMFDRYMAKIKGQLEIG
jgi:tetratricopeptide (TPR) repeat protein